MFDYTARTSQKTGCAGSGKTLTPHPDGKAWNKCCRSEGISCAFAKNQASGARITKDDGNRPAVVYPLSEGGSLTAKQVPFFCCHRVTTDGYHRVCAGWDACFGNKHLAAQER